MKITTGQVGIGILAIYALSLLGGDPEGAQRSQEAQAAKDLVQESRHSERNALRLSAVALQRFHRGCLAVQEISTEQEVFHAEGTLFLDQETGRPFPPNVEICNSRAWTAVTNEEGRATKIAIATAQDSNKNKIPDNIEAQEIYKTYGQN